MTAAPAPHPWDVSIDDHGYILDSASQAWRHESIPLLRPVYVTADRLGENDINPESNWRFSDVDWSHGAGQRRADETDSDTARFGASQGIDVWTKNQLSLLPDVSLVGGSLPANIVLASACIAYGFGTVYLFACFDFGGLYFIEADTLTTGGTWHKVTDAVNLSGYIATDGTYVYYVGSAGSGQTIWRIPADGSTTGASYNTATGYNPNAFCLGRLLAVFNGVIYNITGTDPTTDVVLVGALPAGYSTLSGGGAYNNSTGGNDVGVAAGQNEIYVAGRGGPNFDRTQIFAVKISDDGTTLLPPVAVTPEIGGVCRTLYTYEGLVFIGFDNGFRMCVPQSDGSLSVGALVKTGSPVYGFAGRGKYIYFGWGNYAPAGTGFSYAGIGRIDPTFINADGSPAYASDVMTTASSSAAVVNGVFLNEYAGENSPLIFMVSAGQVVPSGSQGLWIESSNLVASGHIDSGLISYDLPDDKAARYLTVRTDSTSAGVITPSIAINGSSTFTDLNAVASGTLTQRDPITGLSGGYFEIRETLNRNSSDHTKGAVLTRHMLEADPIVTSGFYIYVPVILASTVNTSDGKPHTMKPATELAYLEGLRGTGTIVTYVEPGNTYQVTVEDITWQPTHITTRRDGANGTFLIKLKTI